MIANSANQIYLRYMNQRFLATKRFIDLDWMDQNQKQYGDE